MLINELDIISNEWFLKFIETQSLGNRINNKTKIRSKKMNINPADIVVNSAAFVKLLFPVLVLAVLVKRLGA
jgi:hypothetical protein